MTTWIPTISTPAGRCLTVAEWQAAGIKTLACDLDDLLMKPGLEVLMACSSLASFIGWTSDIILNAANLTINSRASYTVRSIYDGSRRDYTPNELAKLIAHLQPSKVLLPKGMSAIEGVTCLFHYTERPYGFMGYVKTEDPAILLAAIASCDGADCYAVSSLPSRATWMESDKPAQDAYNGLVYSENSSFFITDSSNALNNQCIATTCTCNTCSMPFTRAYLHHLYTHTPLLCQRLLVQHNVHLKNISAMLI